MSVFGSVIKRAEGKGERIEDKDTRLYGDYPEILNKEVKYFVHACCDFDEAVLYQVEEGIKMAGEVILNGEKPRKSGDLDKLTFRLGLSARRDGAATTLELTDQQLFWMSWLKDRIPVCLLRAGEARRYEELGTYIMEVDYLGCYIKDGVLGQPLICLFPDNIETESKRKDCLGIKYLTAKVLIHEFAHAVMDECWRVADTGLDFDLRNRLLKTEEQRNEEEGWANALALQYLKCAMDTFDEEAYKKLYEYAEYFVLNRQPEGYNTGVEKMKVEYGWYDWYQKKIELEENQRQTLDAWGMKK